MNSLPITNSKGIVRGTTAKFTRRASHFQRRATRMVGSYSQPKKREVGFCDSGLSCFPRMNIVISTGTSVIDRMEAATLADELGKPHRLHTRPSWPSRKNRRPKDVTDVASEK